MTHPTRNPLARILIALDRLHGSNLGAVEASAWQEAQEGLLEALAEREALMAVAQEARGMVDAVDEYEAAVEAGKSRLVDKLGKDCVEAEDALVDALNRLHEIQSSEGRSATERVHLTARGRFADGDDNEETRP